MANKYNCKVCGRDTDYFRGAPKFYCDECKIKKQTEWSTNSYLKKKKYYLKQQNDYRKLNRYKKHLENSRQLLNTAISIVFVND